MKASKSCVCVSVCAHVGQIQSQVTPHAIVVLPKTDGMEMLLCYEDEGVYVNTYGRITKDVVLQWGEMPTSVGTSRPPSWTQVEISSPLLVKFCGVLLTSCGRFGCYMLKQNY